MEVSTSEVKSYVTRRLQRWGRGVGAIVKPIYFKCLRRAPFDVNITRRWL